MVLLSFAIESIKKKERAERNSNCVCGVRETFDSVLSVHIVAQLTRETERHRERETDYSCKIVYIYKKAKLLDSLSFFSSQAEIQKIQNQ
jgi:hypothetical protein